MPSVTQSSALQAPECLWFYIFTTDLTDWTDCYLCEAKGKTKTGKTPWRGWRAMSPAAMLTPWSYKSKLLKPKPEAYHHLPYRRSPSSPRR